MAWQIINCLFTISFPDPSAPSVRSVAMQQRLLKRKQNSQDNTLSGYIGSSTSTSEDKRMVNMSNKFYLNQESMIILICLLFLFILSMNLIRQTFEQSNLDTIDLFCKKYT